MAATPSHTQETTKAYYIVLHQTRMAGMAEEDIQYSRQIPHNERPGIKEITKILMTTHTVLSADKSRKIPDSFLKWDDTLHAYTLNFDHQRSTVREREDLKFIISTQAPQEGADFYFRIVVNKKGSIKRLDLFVDGRQYTIPLDETGHPSNGADLKQEIIRILKNSHFGLAEVAEEIIDIHPISVWTGAHYEWTKKRGERREAQKEEYDRKHTRGIPAADIALVRDMDPKSPTYGEVLITPKVLVKAKQFFAGDDKLVPTIKYYCEKDTGKFLRATLFYYEAAENAFKEYPLTAEEIRRITDDSNPTAVMGQLLESKIPHHIFIQEVGKIKKPDQVSPQFIFTISHLPEALVQSAGGQIAAVATELGVHPNQDVYLHHPLQLNASGTMLTTKEAVDRRGSRLIKQSELQQSQSQSQSQQKSKLLWQSMRVEAAKDEETSVYNFELTAVAKVTHDAKYYILDTAKIHYRQEREKSVTVEIDLNSKDAFELLLLNSVVKLIQQLDLPPQQKLFLELNATFTLMKSFYSPKVDDQSSDVAAMDPLALPFTAELAKLQSIPLFHEDGRVNAEMIKALNDLMLRKKIPADAVAIFGDLYQRLNAMHEEQIAELNKLDFRDDKLLRPSLEKWVDNLEHMLMVYGYDKNAEISVILSEIKREIRSPKMAGMVNRTLLKHLHVLSSEIKDPTFVSHILSPVYSSLEAEYERNKAAQEALFLQHAQWPEKIQAELASLLDYLKAQEAKRITTQRIKRPSGVLNRIIEQQGAWDALLKRMNVYLSNEENRVLLLQGDAAALKGFQELLKTCLEKIDAFSANETGFVYSYPDEKDKEFHAGVEEKCGDVKRRCLAILSGKEVNSPVQAASQSDPTGAAGAPILVDLHSEPLLPGSMSKKPGGSSSISVSAPDPQDPFDAWVPAGSTLPHVENDPFLSDFAPDPSNGSASSSSSSAAPPPHAAILSLYASGLSAPLTPTPMSEGSEGHSLTAPLPNVEEDDSSPVGPPPPLPPRDPNPTPASHVSLPPLAPNPAVSNSSASASSKVGPPSMGSSLSFTEVMKKPPKLKPAQVSYQLGLYQFKKEDGKLPPSNSYPVLIKYEDGTFALLQKGEKTPLDALGVAELAGFKDLPFAEDLIIIDTISPKVAEVLRRYTTAPKKSIGGETGMTSDLKNVLAESMAGRREALESKKKALLPRSAYRLERVESCPAKVTDDAILYFEGSTRTCYLVPPCDTGGDEEDWDTSEFEEFQLAEEILIPTEDKDLLNLLLDTAVKKNLITLRADSPSAGSSSSFFSPGSVKGNEGEASEKKEEKEESSSPKSPLQSSVSFHSSPSDKPKEGSVGAASVASGKISLSLTGSQGE